MTERLYYADAYLTRFDAVVAACEGKEGEFLVRLDRSAFYPTSGGQPFDLGTLSGANILDVCVDGDDVVHVVDRALQVGARVTGEIDWARRFDHMQQHAGEHMLAGVVFTRLQGHTIGLHLGADVSTIDVELPGGQMRADDLLAEIEDEVNRQIQADLPIRCWFPNEEELRRAPLRKPPTVTEHVRLVQVGEVECVACGGTHPSSSGQVGLLKIVDARPSRGKMRITFVCGMRAIRDYRMRFDAAGEAAALLSTGVPELKEAAGRALNKLREAERALGRAKTALTLSRMDELFRGAHALPDGRRAVSAVVEDAPPDALLQLATGLSGRGVYALIASSGGEGARLVFAAPAGAAERMGALLSGVVKRFHGKGGGRDDLAQGAGPGRACLDAALDRLHEGGQA